MMDMTMAPTGSKPSHWTQVLGQPLFKTVKMMGAHSIAADVFGRNPESTVYPGNTKTCGAGIYAHRDGYNVLYGDWSSKWYGDPQQRIIWQSYAGSSGIVTGNPDYKYVSGLASVWADPLNDLGYLDWHNFDNATGVDVGVWTLP
jgi:hypothetical protein